MRLSLAALVHLGLIACAPVVTARTTCVPCGVAPVVDAALARVDAGSPTRVADAAVDASAVDGSVADAAVESPYSSSMRRQIAQWVTEASRLSERSLSVVCAGSASRVTWERGLFSIDCAIRDDASGYERAYRVFATATYEHLPAMTPWNDRMQFAKHCAAEFALASMQSWLEAHHDLLGVHSTEPSAHPRLLAYRTANTSTVCVSSQPAHDAPYDACWTEPGMVDRIDERSFDFARDGDRVGAVRYDARMPDATAARVRVTFDEAGRARMSRGRAAARVLATTAFPATGPLALLSARTQRLTGAGPLAIEWFSERQWLRCELIDRWRCQRAPRDR